MVLSRQRLGRIVIEGHVGLVRGATLEMLL